MTWLHIQKDARDAWCVMWEEGGGGWQRVLHNVLACLRCQRDPPMGNNDALISRLSPEPQPGGRSLHSLRAFLHSAASCEQRGAGAAGFMTRIGASAQCHWPQWPSKASQAKASQAKPSESRNASVNPGPRPLPDPTHSCPALHSCCMPCQWMLL